MGFVMLLDAWLDAAVQAVRGDKVVGRGTCSTVDEAMTDQELREVLVGMYDKADGKIAVSTALARIKKTERVRRSYEEDICGA